MRVIRDVLAPRHVIQLDRREKGISVRDFEREMGIILHEIGYEDFAWEVEALQVLREAAEDHLIEIFEKSCGVQSSKSDLRSCTADTNLYSGAMARQAGRLTVGIDEIRFCRFVLGRRKYDW